MQNVPFYMGELFSFFGGGPSLRELGCCLPTSSPHLGAPQLWAVSEEVHRREEETPGVAGGGMEGRMFSSDSEVLGSPRANPWGPPIHCTVGVQA